MSAKIRHEFLADADVTALLNLLVQDSGATKTDIIVRALKAFAERGIESEFTQLTAKRFDTLSREIESVRRVLEKQQNDLERLRGAGVATQVIFKSFIRLFVALSAHIPMPEGETKAVSNKRFDKFADDVNGILDELRASSPPA
ncbi:MAG: hypothetical protein WC521_06180 [Bdellovibrionales bacterium]